MPNTIAHIAVQTFLTRGLLRHADFKWILAGCVLPDIPWILQRAVIGVAPHFPTIPLRLYATVQSSLIVTLILCAALALLSRYPKRTLAILAFGITLHLLLDATQTKWANGVLLFAPFSWDLFNLGLYWPESFISMALSLVGVGVMIYAVRVVPPVRGRATLRPMIRPALAAVLGLIYVLLPMLLMPGAHSANLHYAATLDQDAERVGAPIEFDRALLQTGPDGAALLRAWTGETFVLHGVIEEGAEIVSVRGTFIEFDSIRIDDIFVHRPAWRAILSQIGLLFIAFWWARCLRLSKSRD